MVGVFLSFYDRNLLNLSDSGGKAASLDCLYSRRFAASPDCNEPHYLDPSLQRVVCGISTSCRHDSPNERRNSSNCIHAPYIKDVQALRREYASLTRSGACVDAAGSLSVLAPLNANFDPSCLISWRGPENSRKRAAEREGAEKKERRRRKGKGGAPLALVSTRQARPWSPPRWGKLSSKNTLSSLFLRVE